MNFGSAIVVAAALIAGAIVAGRAFSQSTTTDFATGLVVTTCGTAPTLPGSSPWSYVTGHQAPLTMSTGGALCVNQ